MAFDNISSPSFPMQQPYKFKKFKMQYLFDKIGLNML